MHTRKGFLKKAALGLAGIVPGALFLAKVTAIPAWARGTPAPTGIPGVPIGYCFCDKTLSVYNYVCQPRFVCQMSWPYVPNMWVEIIDHWDYVFYYIMGWEILCGAPQTFDTSLCCTGWNHP